MGMPTTKKIKIPVVMGRNRIRGKAEGAMIFDDFEDNLGRLRNVMREEAKLANVEPTDEWLATAVSQLLRLYEKAHADWLADKDGTVGPVYEASLPSGCSLLFADERVLARIS